MIGTSYYSIRPSESDDYNLQPTFVFVPLKLEISQSGHSRVMIALPDQVGEVGRYDTWMKDDGSWIMVME